MSRINWMNIITWLGLVVTIVLACGFGYFQWNRLQVARADGGRLDQQVALQEKERQSLESLPRPPTSLLTSPDSGSEEVEFLRQLQFLMTSSGVKQVQIDRAPLMPLPTIGRPPGPGSNAPKSADNRGGPPEPSLTNLPLGARAASTNLIVQGFFPNIHLFVHQLRNYRYQTRAINVNSLNITTMGDKGVLRATMTLTRFIRPAETTLTPIPSTAPPAPGANPVPQASLPRPGMP